MRFAFCLLAVFASMIVGARSDQLTLKIKTTGRNGSFIILGEEDWTVRDLCGAIKKDLKIKCENQMLVFAGKKLQEDRTLADYNIEKYATIHLTELKPEKCANKTNFQCKTGTVVPRASFRSDSTHEEVLRQVQIGCIPSSMKCNGVQDCADNSDETDCPARPPCKSKTNFQCTTGTVDMNLESVRRAIKNSPNPEEKREQLLIGCLNADATCVIRADTYCLDGSDRGDAETIRKRCEPYWSIP